MAFSGRYLGSFRFDEFREQGYEPVGVPVLVDGEVGNKNDAANRAIRLHNKDLEYEGYAHYDISFLLRHYKILVAMEKIDL